MNNQPDAVCRGEKLKGQRRRRKERGEKFPRTGKSRVALKHWGNAVQGDRVGHRPCEILSPLSEGCRSGDRCLVPAILDGDDEAAPNGQLPAFRGFFW